MATDIRNPTSEVAVTGTWSGTNRHLLVDDYPTDTTGVDKTTCSAAGVALFGFTAFSIPAGSTALSVQVLYYDSKNGTQSSTDGAAIRCNDTTNRLAGTHNPANASFQARSDNYATNPKTSSAWTVNDVNGVGTNGLTAFGLSVTDASPTVDLACIALQVTYTPPITGDLATTEAKDVAALAGQAVVGAVVAAADVADTTGNSLAGTVEWPVITSTVAASDVLDLFAAAGDVTGEGSITASLEATEVPDSVVLSVDAIIGASLAAVDVTDTSALAGQVVVGTTVTTTDTPDVVSVSDSVLVEASVTINDVPDSMTGVGGVLISSTAALVDVIDAVSLRLQAAGGDALLPAYIIQSGQESGLGFYDSSRLE